MTREDVVDADLPTHDQAAEFYAKYEPKEVLGRGVSSVVRRCIEKRTSKEYAVKIIDISGERAEDYLVQQTKLETKREIDILKACAGQTNIIEMADSFETPAYIFLVFELCKKGELFDYLTEVVTLSEKRTRAIMKQLLEAISFIHSKEIVHRDLKPENILMGDNLNIKLSDFGFATTLQPGEELMELCGTPAYLAPEVLAVSMYDNVPGYGKEVDMWACGVIMYTLLVGSPPFWHRKQMYMIRAIMQGNYEFGSPEWDDISSLPKDLISKLLVVESSQRLTAREALAHPFFRRTTLLPKLFNARRTFRVAATMIIFYFRLRRFYFNPPPILMKTVSTNPYGVKHFRKVIDGCAFRIYGHWVKKGDNQNRAALFEHTMKDWKNDLANS